MRVSIRWLCFPFMILLRVQHSVAQDCNEENKVLLVKLGGSCLTDKAQRETLNATLLDWFSSTIAQVRQSSKCQFILIHGAGSFGHFTAKEYGIRKIHPEPILRPEMQRHVIKGVAETRRLVQSLNQLVITSLLSYNVPAVGLSPLSLGLVCPTNPETRLEYQIALQRLVATTLDAGLVPVLHGDACLYGPHGAGVLGGDTLMELLQADRAIFLTDVKGVYTNNPHTDPDATLVERIEVNEDGTLKTDTAISTSGSHHTHDVTGGLEGKLSSAIILAKKNIPVLMVECGSKSAEQALRGGTWDVGTHIVRRWEIIDTDS